MPPCRNSTASTTEADSTSNPISRPITPTKTSPQAATLQAITITVPERSQEILNDRLRHIYALLKEQETLFFRNYDNLVGTNFEITLDKLRQESYFLQQQLAYCEFYTMIRSTPRPPKYNVPPPSSQQAFP